MRDSWKLVGLMLIRGVEKSQLRHALLTIIKYLLLNRKNSCNWTQVFCVTSGTTPCWLEAAKEINRKPKHCYTGALSIARSNPAHRHKLKPWVRASKRQTLPPWFRQLELQLSQRSLKDKLIGNLKPFFKFEYLAFFVMLMFPRNQLSHPGCDQFSCQVSIRQKVRTWFSWTLIKFSPPC